LQSLSWWGGLPHPHTAVPYAILSLCRIEENWAGNDILIIVNGLLTIAPDAIDRDWTRHSGANITASVGPTASKLCRIRLGERRVDEFRADRFTGRFRWAFAACARLGIQPKGLQPPEHRRRRTSVTSRRKESKRGVCVSRGFYLVLAADPANWPQSQRIGRQGGRYDRISR
jgi:hypothetical protein